MTHSAKLLTAAAVSVLLAGCSLPGVYDDGQADPTALSEIRVTNNNWADVRIYAERDGLRMRLGTVTSMATVVYMIPRQMVGGNGLMRVVADPIGSADRFVTHAMQVWPGELVELTVSNDLPISTAMVKTR